MIDRSESVHVHRGDAALLIEEYRQKGFVLKEQTKPTVIAQRGFVQLVFVPAEDYVPEPQVEEIHEPKRRILFF